MERRKVAQLGGSVAVTIPADFAEANEIRPGQDLFVVKNRRSILFTVDPELAAELAEPIHAAAEKALKRQMKGERGNGRTT